MTRSEAERRLIVGGSRHRRSAARSLLRRSRIVPTIGAVVLTVALAGCGLSIPTDPDGTLDRVTGGELRAGASPAAGLVDIDDGEVSGPLVDLVEGFAASRDADVTWTVGSEEDLAHGLAEGDLDVAVGGMTATTPWVDEASVTRAYPDIPGSRGADVVLLLPIGENALQSALEEYLDREVGG
jgi:hypothetical protein